MNLTGVLKRARQPTRVEEFADGTRILVLLHGGRLLGIFARGSEENFYWTNPALTSVEGARNFFASQEWHNTGGDRTWLAPEIDFFLPDFPKIDSYFQQRALDPGNYKIVKVAGGWKLVNRLIISLSRANQRLHLRMSKSFGPAPNPLRHERGAGYQGLEYAGYTQTTSLELVGASGATAARVGLWNLLQLPHGGQLVVPTYCKTKPVCVFGSISRKDLSVTDKSIRYRMWRRGGDKISIRAVSICGRAGYLYPSLGKRALVVRNFWVNPSGEYVDTPWNNPEYPGFAVQACNVNLRKDSFSELEYHVPAIGGGTGRRSCEEQSQVWAFRGTERQIAAIEKTLLGR
jgi:hypothetical protein